MEFRMRCTIHALIGFFVFAALTVGAQSMPTTNFSTVNFESRIVEDFDENPTSRWIARGSKFTTIEYDESGRATRMFPVLADVPGFPQALFGRSLDKPDRGALGLWGKFDRKGYNFIEIIPAAEAPADADDSQIIYESLEDGTRWVHAPIDLPGRISYIDMWVWGSNHKYYLDLHVEDHRGIDYVLKLGDLSYVGWRNLRIGIPNYISQSVQYLPRFRNMRITKLTLWTRPQEKVDEFFVYFDHLKVLTDLFESRYDGDDFEQADFMQETWGKTWD